MNLKYIQYLSFPKQLFFIVKLVSQKDYKLLKYLFELFVKESKLSRLKTIICLRYFTIYKVLNRDRNWTLGHNNIGDHEDTDNRDSTINNIEYCCFIMYDCSLSAVPEDKD